jgi:hypothetical protein
MNPELLNRLQPFRMEALRRGIPSQDVERWIATARPSGTLVTTGDGPVVGRFGGPLMLPADTPDPEYPLFATLDCAALPEEVTGLPLPPDGTLLLFGFPDSEYFGEWTSIGEVRYIPAGTPVEERKIMKYGCFYDGEGNALQPSDLRAYEDYPQDELYLSADVTLPFHSTTRDGYPDATLPGHPRSSELHEAWDATWGSIIINGDLRIGGYAFWSDTETDPVEDAARDARQGRCRGEHGPGDPCVAADLPAPEDWVLLAQWQSDLYRYEGATMHWVIPRQDLTERRFDRAHVSLQWNP